MTCAIITVLAMLASGCIKAARFREGTNGNSFACRRFFVLMTNRNVWASFCFRR